MPTSAAANPATCGRFQRPIGITQTSAYYLEQSARFAPAGSDIGVEMSAGPSLANGPASGRIAAKPRLRSATGPLVLADLVLFGKRCGVQIGAGKMGLLPGGAAVVWVDKPDVAR